MKQNKQLIHCFSFPLPKSILEMCYLIVHNEKDAKKYTLNVLSFIKSKMKSTYSSDTTKISKKLEFCLMFQIVKILFGKKYLLLLKIATFILQYSSL